MGLQEEISVRLVKDFSFKSRPGWLQQGKCPECHKKEVFAPAEKTYWVRCGRENKCGWNISVKDLYPDLFESFTKFYPPTEINPNATAEAYLSQHRGFDLKPLAGCFEQGSFYDSVKKVGTPTVRFFLDAEKRVFWERFIENVSKIGRKAHFKGKYGGLWWQPPGLEIKEGDEIWLVEGVFDAIALMQSGIKAVALLSCNNYPVKMLDELKDAALKFVWALDGDKAGRKFTRKHIRRMRAAGFVCSAAIIPQSGRDKLDWNDKFQQGKLEEEHLKKYRYHGKLLVAPSPSAKALVMYHENNQRKFMLDFANQVYWFDIDYEKYQKSMDQLQEAKPDASSVELRDEALKESSAMRRLANCRPVFLYFQQNTVTDEAWYYCEIRRPNGKPAMKNTFTAAQIAGSSEFKKRLLHVCPGALFKGNSEQLDYLIEPTDGIKTVETIDFTGYSKTHGCYVFGDIAVKSGQVYPINQEDYFDLGKLSIKSLSQSVNLQINSDPDAPAADAWLDTMQGAFGAKSVVCLAYWLGTLFAEQIRDVHKSFPFLEVVGEPGSGKSTLIEFLWKILGRRDYEGFDPAKGTAAGRRRNLSQVSNLPVVLIEADRDESKGRAFDWDELKTAYNGRSVATRGVKNSGNETYEPPFRGSIVITQNASVNASDAILQRIVHVEFTRDEHSFSTKKMAEALERMALEDVSGFLLRAIRAESTVMDTVLKQTPVYESLLMDDPEIKHGRLAKNHAQVMALVDALDAVVPLGSERKLQAHDLLIELTKERQVSIDADHPVVSQFWETFDYLNHNNELNHSPSQGIALSLNDFVEHAKRRGQEMQPMIELKRHLKTSKLRKFLCCKNVNSVVKQKTVHCWVFGDGS